MENNPVERQKLFSDSNQAAKEQDRKKVTGKTPKSFWYQKIAEHVFSVDEDPATCSDFQLSPGWYAKSVDNLITRLAPCTH